MEAIVLAGGFGSRLRSVVSDVPKPMAPVAGKPFLEHLFGMLAKHGFQRITLSLGHLAQVAVDHFGGAYRGIPIVYEIEPCPLGTGGAARAALRRCTEDHAFVFNGDTYAQFDIAAVEHTWRKRRLPVIVAREVEDTSRYGSIDVRNDLVRNFCEKRTGGPGLINAGIYLLPRDALDQLPDNQAFSLERDYLSAAVHQRDFVISIADGLFIDIGIPEDYHRAQDLLAGTSG